jgi:hypothetical protein
MGTSSVMDAAGENSAGIPPKILPSGRYYLFLRATGAATFMVGSMGLDPHPKISDQRIPL